MDYFSSSHQVPICTVGQTRAMVSKVSFTRNNNNTRLTTLEIELRISQITWPIYVTTWLCCLTRACTHTHTTHTHTMTMTIEVSYPMDGGNGVLVLHVTFAQLQHQAWEKNANCSCLTYVHVAGEVLSRITVNNAHTFFCDTWQSLLQVIRSRIFHN